MTGIALALHFTARGSLSYPFQYQYREGKTPVAGQNHRATDQRHLTAMQQSQFGQTSVNINAGMDLQLRIASSIFTRLDHDHKPLP